MSSHLKLIRNNIFSITTLQILSMLLNIITFGKIARVLSIEDFGTFNYILVIIGFSATIIDLGVNPIVLRETAKNHNFNDYIGSTIMFKSVLIFILILIINVFIYIYNIPSTEKILINLFIINIFLSNKHSNIRELLIIPYKVSLKMRFPMLLVLLDAILLLLFTFLIQDSKYALINFSIAYVFSNLLSTIILFKSIKTKERITFNFNKNILKAIIKTSLPIYGYLGFRMIFRQMDIFLIGVFIDEKAVALYSSALRLSDPFIIFASAISVTFFPIIVRQLNNNQNISYAVSAIFKVLIVLSISIAMIIFFNAHDIITAIFGSKYILASMPLKFLSFTIIFSFLNFFMVDLLTALNRQKLSLIYSILITIISIPLYILVIPNFSFIGASIVKLSAILGGTLFLYYFLLKDIQIDISYVNIFFWILFNIIIFTILSRFNLYISLIIGGSILMITAILFNVFKYNELNIIFRTINKEKYLEKIKPLVIK